MRLFVRDPFNYSMDDASNETAIDCSLGGPSVTQQQFKDDADINVIVSRFGLDPFGPMPTEAPSGLSVDFSQVGDYRTCLDAIRAADAAFMAFPADFRARFANDPARLLGFLEDSSNRDEAVKLGLIPAPPAPPSDPAKPAV